MSESDDITQALLAGTLGIGQHGVAEPGVERPDDAPPPRPNRERHGVPRRGFEGLQVEVNDIVERIRGRMSELSERSFICTTPAGSANWPRGWVDDLGAWVPARRLLRCHRCQVPDDEQHLVDYRRRYYCFHCRDLITDWGRSRYEQTNCERCAAPLDSNAAWTVAHTPWRCLCGSCYEEVTR